MEEKKELFHNQTTYTYEEYLKLNQFNLYHAKKAGCIFVAVCIILILVCAIVLAILGNYFNAMLYFLIDIVFFLFLIFLPKLQSKKIYHSDKILKDNIKNDFSFYEEEIEVTNIKSTSHIQYTDIYKIYETKDAFYFYINRIQVFIVTKSGFQEENSLQEIREFLQRKCPENYKKVK